MCVCLCVHTCKRTNSSEETPGKAQVRNKCGCRHWAVTKGPYSFFLISLFLFFYLFYFLPLSFSSFPLFFFYSVFLSLPLFAICSFFYFFFIINWRQLTIVWWLVCWNGQKKNNFAHVRKTNYIKLLSSWSFFFPSWFFFPPNFGGNIDTFLDGISYKVILKVWPMGDFKATHAVQWTPSWTLCWPCLQRGST